MISANAMVLVVAILSAAIVSIVIFAPDPGVGLQAVSALSLPVMAYFMAQMQNVGRSVEQIKHQTNDLAEKAQAGARAEGVLEGAAEQKARGEA